MGGDKILDSLLSAARDSSEDNTTKSSYLAVFSTYGPALLPLDGAKELLEQLHDSGLAVALASSAQDLDLQALRRTIGADAFIDAATSSTDAEERANLPRTFSSLP
jgi:phosphoglycolate phosphatase-like HAD superfamily hydrolase